MLTSGRMLILSAFLWMTWGQPHSSPFTRRALCLGASQCDGKCSTPRFSVRTRSRAIKARTIFSTTSALMAFPRASNATVLACGKMLKFIQALEPGIRRGVIYRRSQAMIGTWVLVIAISDGELVGRLTRTPDARNWMTYRQMSRGPPLQFHSSFLQA